MILNIVCPFCESQHPVPIDFDDVYTCGCGACYRICSTNFPVSEMTTISNNIGENDCLVLPEEEQMGFCQIVVNREFDQLISLKQSMDDTSEMRFCKFDPSAELALVWMKRP